MGRHNEWRKIAKKMRRKRIRQSRAKTREALEKEEEERRKKSPGYAARLVEEEIYQLALEEAEKQLHDELQRKWEEEEERVREATKKRQARLKEMEEAAEREKVEREERIRKKEQAEKEKREKMTDYIYQFSIGEKCGLPAEMLIPSETQPGKEVCPFFSKVAACRFYDVCSRNHIRPALSDTLLFPRFYSHFNISQIGKAEYDTDIDLESDDRETYDHFKSFYFDVRKEFETCGRLTRMLVCCNSEPHLRGNVYVSYALEREAMTAYLKFNGRFYAGKQLSCEFVTIPSWKSAICGLFFKKTCPKGNTCNFLHIFKDPGAPFYVPPEPSHNGHSPNSWRWSESPDRDDENGNSSRKEKRKRERRSSSRDRRRKRSHRRERKRSSERGRRSKSSDRSTRSVKRHSRSPKRRSRSPKRPNKTPKRRSSSPKRLTETLRRQSRTPKRHSRSPKQRSKSKSPKRRNR